MASPDTSSTEGGGRRSSAILPNPFIVSENPRAPVPADTSSSQTNGTENGAPGPAPNLETRRRLLAEYPAPDFGGGLLPQPIPILDFDGEPETSSQLTALHPTSEETDGVGLPPSISSQLRGIKLFGAVFSELSKQLGKDFSAAELMRAAQQLIDISKAEYIGVRHKDGTERAGYYSLDLVRAFDTHPWQIAGVETSRMDHCDTDEFSLESFENAKTLLQGWHERTWEF